MTVDNLSVYRVKPSREDDELRPERRRFMIFLCNEPCFCGRTLSDALDAFVTKEVIPGRNAHVKQDTEDIDMGAYQELDLEKQISESDVGEMVQRVTGFYHTTGCGETLLRTDTLVKKIVEELSVGAAIVVMGKLGDVETLADIVGVVVSSTNIRKEAIVGWSEDMTMIHGEPSCCYCGGEVRL